MLRRPDRHPEMWSLDDLLREDVSDEELASLLGRGKRLDSEGYFSGTAESRLANKILKDNQVLPTQLEDRRKVEKQVGKKESRLHRSVESYLGQRAELQSRVAPSSPHSCRSTPSWRLRRSSIGRATSRRPPEEDDHRPDP